MDASMDAWGYLSAEVWDDAAVDEPLDAWPERGASVWQAQPAREPLLPPLPAASSEDAPLGWVLEWPVAWLGDVAIESWGHWGRPAAPRRSARQSPRHAPGPRVAGSRPAHPPRVARAPRVYAPRRRRGGAIILVATLLLASALGMLTLGHSFPALGQQLDALRDGASNLGNGLGNGVSGGIGGAPQGTATAAAPLVPPALGSDAEAFAAFYGTRFLGTGATHFQVQLHGVPISLDLTFGLGADHRDRVTALAVGSATLAGWNAATADAICGTFLPPDAQLAGVTHADADVEYRYTSASLAAAFPPAYFVDDGYNPVAPGTFTRLDAPPLGGATGVGSCTLSLGAH